MSFASLSLLAESAAGAEPRLIDLPVSNLIVTGWAGRDHAALQAHIDELALLGVTPPSQVPCFYRVSANQITAGQTMQVLGGHTSGEAEFVLVPLEDGLWIGAGSDETDRELEAHSVAASKQICAKSIARTLWRFDDVAPHWDQLRLRSWMTTNGERRLYQDGLVNTLRRPEDLLQRLAATDVAFVPGTVVYSGTCSVIGEIGGGTRFDYELHDPVLGRTIRHGYDVAALPVVG